MSEATMVRNAFWGMLAVCVHVVCVGSFVLCLVTSFTGHPWGPYPLLILLCPLIAFVYILWLQFLIRRTGW